MRTSSYSETCIFAISQSLKGFTIIIQNLSNSISFDGFPWIFYLKKLKGELTIPIEKLSNLISRVLYGIYPDFLVWKSWVNFYKNGKIYDRKKLG